MFDYEIGPKSAWHEPAGTGVDQARVSAWHVDHLVARLEFGGAPLLRRALPGGCGLVRVLAENCVGRWWRPLGTVGSVKGQPGRGAKESRFRFSFCGGVDAAVVGLEGSWEVEGPLGVLGAAFGKDFGDGTHQAFDASVGLKVAPSSHVVFHGMLCEKFLEVIGLELWSRVGMEYLKWP